jgi:ATP-dependent Lon protease
MDDESKSEHAVRIPHDLPILPLRNTVAYPLSVLPLMVGVPRSVRLIEDVSKGEGLIGLLASRDGTVEEPQPGQVHEVGTVAKIDRVTRSSGNNFEVVVRGLERFRIEHWLESDPYLRARISLFP